MARVLVRILAVIGGLVVLMVLIGLGFATLFRLSRAGVPARTILELDLETNLIEAVPRDPIAAVLLRETPVLRQTVEALEMAAEDDRVVGLIATGGAAPMGMAQRQEIRDAILNFRAHGKPAVVFAETFGEFGPGNASYYMATAFDEVWLQPTGDIGLTGLIFEVPFLKGTLEKLGLEPRVDHRKEYKAAKNLLTETALTGPHREALQGVLSSWFGQITKGIAEARNLEVEQVRAIADRGPLRADEALEANLVDGLAYRDEVYARVREQVGSGAELLYLKDYIARAGELHDTGPTIALIYGVGPLVRGPSTYEPLNGESRMGSESVTAAFRSAVKDDQVRAIVFRIDSPGGSPVGSDAIWREVTQARESGKPVVVSMGNLAASAGYAVAMSADKIVAEPGTLTGSIGIYAGKMLITGLTDKLGLSWDEVHTSASSTYWSPTHDYRPAEWQRLQDFLDWHYRDFTTKVAEGRNLPIEKVLEVAKGRVWTGEDAKRLGLVDELGGMDLALRLAKEAAGISEEEEVWFRVYPREKSPLELLLEPHPSSSEARAALALARQTLDQVQPWVRQARRVGLMPGSGFEELMELVAQP